MVLDGARGVDDRFEPAVRGPEVAPFEKPGGLFGTGLLVEVLERRPELIGPRDLEGSHRQRIQRGTLALRPVLGVAQPDVSCALRQRVRLSLGAPRLIDGVVGDFDGMELDGQETPPSLGWPPGHEDNANRAPQSNPHAHTAEPESGDGPGNAAAAVPSRASTPRASSPDPLSLRALSNDTAPNTDVCRSDP